MFGNNKSVSDLAKELAVSETTLEQKYEANKKILREKFLIKLKNIFQSKKENVTMLEKSIVSIQQQKDLEQKEMEAAEAKLKELGDNYEH